MMKLSKANKKLSSKNIWIYQEDGLFYWYTLFGLNGVEPRKEGPFSSVYMALRNAAESLPYEEEKELLESLDIQIMRF